MIEIDDKTKERFWKKVAPPDENGCMDWLASTTPNGYGQFHPVRNMPIPAHRFSYMLIKGPILNGLYCLHVCDRHICVAPDHLFLGTQADNMNDMKMKNRHLPGSKNGSAKLTELDVLKIRESTLSGSQLGNIYGLNSGSINRIKRRERWTHI